MVHDFRCASISSTFPSVRPSARQNFGFPFCQRFWALTKRRDDIVVAIGVGILAVEIKMDMVADMEVEMVADMDVDMVDDMMVDMVADMEIDKMADMEGWFYWS